MKKIAAMIIGALLVSINAYPVLAEGTAATPETTAPAVSSETSAAPPVAEPPSAAEAGKTKTVRIGYVDMATIAKESAPGKAAYAEIKSKTEKYQKQIKAKEKQLQNRKADIEKQLPSLTPQQREAKAKEFQKKIEELQKFVQKADKDMRGREEELLTRLFKSVDEAANRYAKDNGFTAVVLKNQLLYSAKDVETSDITAEIIKMVEAAPKK